MAFVKYKSILLVFILLVSFYNCARVGRPTGGEKDVLPPVSISATPDFESLNFKGNKIKINFNEYIKFDDLNRQLVISPPLNYTPDISPLGFPSKEISIKIKDTLKANTTYTFNFGNAITDNSEGNPLRQFKYLFSTGNHIDSLAISGTIKDAFLSKNPENISVLLYLADSTYKDSTIYSKKPSYVTNTLDSTFFSVTNVKDGKYRVVALNDKNKNLLFDPSEDKIGFIEGAIDIAKDTTYHLNLFLEEPVFAVKKVEQASKNHIIVAYEGPLMASVEKLMDKNSKNLDFISYRDQVTDSLHIWHQNLETDSLFISLKQKDSLLNFTQRLRLKEIDSIRISKNIGNTLHFRDSLFIIANTPISSTESNKISLMDNDSVEIPFRIIKDRLPDRFLIDFDKKEQVNYTLSFSPTAVTDYLGQQNDSLQFKFRTKKKADYGTIVIQIIMDDIPIIIELLDEKGELIERDFLKNTKELTYSSLQAGKYQIRAIFDENDNKKWDTGSFLNKKQPERVIYYSKIIDVRANWTISEDFILK